MQAPEPSCILKLKRAYVHLKELDIACQGWLAAHNKFTCRLEPCTDTPGYFWIKAACDPIPNEPFPVLIGDVVQNLRGALDHLIYALGSAHSGTLSEQDARYSQFPIIGDESETGTKGIGQGKWRDNALPQMVPKLSPQAQAVIEGLQPFKLGSNFRTHILWRLNELVNRDKHRFVHVAVAQGSGMSINTNRSRNLQILPGVIHVYAPVMNGETVIAKIRLAPIDARSEMHVEINPVLSVCFKDGISEGKEVIKELGEIHNFVVKDIFPKLMPLI